MCLTEIVNQNHKYKSQRPNLNKLETMRPGDSPNISMHPPGQILMGAKLFPRVYRITRIFISMNKLIPTICYLTVSMATPILLN